MKSIVTLLNKIPDYNNLPPSLQSHIADVCMNYAEQAIDKCAEEATAYKQGAFGKYHHRNDIHVDKQSILKVKDMLE